MSTTLNPRRLPPGRRSKEAEMRLRQTLLPLVMGGSALLYGQAPKAKAAPAPAPAKQGGQAPAEAPPAAPDDITVITPVLYQPSLKRDPFATPSEDTTKNQGNLVEDIAVKGVVRGNDGKYLAVIVDSHGKTSFVPVGFKLR